MRTGLRVMTYNIRKGLGASGKTKVLKDLREAIRKVEADLVFLQEVMGHSEHEEHRQDGFTGDQLEFLADSVWPHRAYGRNAIRSSGHHGNAILSKIPFKRWENIDISTNPFESRGLLHGVLGWPDKKTDLHLICLHLNLFERSRAVQVGALAKRVQETVPAEVPLLIAGDFNDWRGKATLRLEKELNVKEVGNQNGGTHNRTFPSWLPILPLDRIYFRKLKLADVKVTDVKAWKNLSDHQALIAEFLRFD